jgi:hypothetical protein
MTFTQEQYEVAQDILRHHGNYEAANNLQKAARVGRLKEIYGEDFFKQVEELIEVLQEDNGYDLEFCARSMIELFEDWGVAKKWNANATDPKKETDDEVEIYLSWKDVPPLSIVKVVGTDFLYFYKAQGHSCYQKSQYGWASIGENIPVKYQDEELELVALNIERRVLL